MPRKQVPPPPPGYVVWVKMAGYPWWPAETVSEDDVEEGHEDDVKAAKADHKPVLVLYFGDPRMYGWHAKKDVRPWDPNVKAFSKPKPIQAPLKEALAAVEEEHLQTQAWHTPSPTKKRPRSPASRKKEKRKAKQSPAQDDGGGASDDDGDDGYGVDDDDSANGDDDDDDDFMVERGSPEKARPARAKSARGAKQGKKRKPKMVSKASTKPTPSQRSKSASKGQQQQKKLKQKLKQKTKKPKLQQQQQQQPSKAAVAPDMSAQDMTPKEQVKFLVSFLDTRHECDSLMQGLAILESIRPMTVDVIQDTGVAWAVKRLIQRGDQAVQAKAKELYRRYLFLLKAAVLEEKKRAAPTHQPDSNGKEDAPEPAAGPTASASPTAPEVPPVTAPQSNPPQTAQAVPGDAAAPDPTTEKGE